MKRKRKRKPRECAYCGDDKEITRDHVIPQCLFKQPYPLNLTTVPACQKCNNAKSRNDDYLRDLVTTDVYGSQSTVAREVFKDTVLRSAAKNKSLMLREFLANVHLEPLYSKGGVYLGDFPSAPADEERIKAVFSTIARGLYFDHRHQRIPIDYDFGVLRYHPWDFKSIWEGFKNLHLNGPRILGNVFGCVYASAREDPATTLWLMWFYETFFVSVSAIKPELMSMRSGPP